MARANLKISPTIFETFISAQDLSNSIRSMKIIIEDETLSIGAVINKRGLAREDFESLKDGVLEERQASLIIFCLDEEKKSETESLKWLLLAYVPDDCRVRDKMLYSSSREDLKRSLGLGYFIAGTKQKCNMNFIIRPYTLIFHLIYRICREHNGGY